MIRLRPYDTRARRASHRSRRRLLPLGMAGAACILKRKVESADAGAAAAAPASALFSDKSPRTNSYATKCSYKCNKANELPDLLIMPSYDYRMNLNSAIDFFERINIHYDAYPVLRRRQTEMTIWEIATNYYQYFLRGTQTTILISLLTVLCGSILGCLIAFMRLSKRRPLEEFAAIYITVIRGPPLLVQLYIVYYQLDFLNSPWSGRCRASSLFRSTPPPTSPRSSARAFRRWTRARWKARARAA